MTGSNDTLGRFVWHDLMSTDVESALAFYAGLFPEWSFNTMPMEGGFDYHMIAAAGDVCGMLQLDEMLGYPSHWIGYVAVQNCDAAVEKIESLGGSCVLPAMDIFAIGRMAIVHDDQGTHFKVFEMSLPRQLPEQPKIGHVWWNELLTPDLPAAGAFYSSLFGWEPAETEIPGLGPCMVFRKDGTDCARAVPLPPGTDAPSNWLPYLAVDDVATRAARVVELGGTTYVEPQAMGTDSRFSVHADPTGAAFGIVQSAGR